MSEQDKNEQIDNEVKNEKEVVEYVLDDVQLAPVSSGEFVGDDELFALVDNDLEELFAIPEPATPSILLEAGEVKPVDPVFEALSIPTLPEPEKENRARLQMQSPNRLYFYWSVKNNPFQTLQKVFGGNTGNYSLVAKLVNQESGREEMHRVEPTGSWWYNVESNATYRAEIGFFAPGRPFVRVIYSNSIETPRKSPSPRQAGESDWAISANAFAEVLDVAGFARDAFEVALAGDDFETADQATEGAFYQLLGRNTDSFSADEIRYALLALASGVGIEELRGQISEALYLVLAENFVRLSAENTMSALKEHFDILDEEVLDFEETGEAVYGASLVHFPKRRVSRAVPRTSIPNERVKFVPRLSPISSSRF